MKLIDRLIDESGKLEGVAVTGDELEELIRDAKRQWPDKSDAELTKMIMSGRLEILGVPVRVRGSIL